MHIYFVRHGETFLNKNNIHQSPNTALSPKGRDDALSVAEYLRGVNPDKILTSGYTRALETARIIGATLGKTAEVYDPLHEMIRPSALYGTSQKSLNTIWYVFLSLVHRNNPVWRYEDAETFLEVKARAERVLAHIAEQEGAAKSIIVVSHNIFINLMSAYMCHGDLNIRTLALAYLHLHMLKNGSVLHMEYTPTTANVCPWRVVKYHVPK